VQGRAEPAEILMGVNRVGVRRLNVAFFQLVLGRLVEPTSMSDTSRVVAEIGLTPAHRNTYANALKRCATNDYRDRVAKKCFEHAAATGGLSLVLYDVTTLYFEAEKEDGLRKVGYSKERRVDPQIVVGLHVDRTGFPLEIGCFEGNEADTVTPRHAKSTVNNVNKRTEPVWDAAGHPKSWRAVWQYSKRRAVRDNQTLNAQEARAREVVDGGTAPKSTRFVKTTAGGRTLDTASLDRARSLVGLKGYVTNIPATLMDPGEVIGMYHDLWHVEQSFRMSKTDLRARPMFHHTRDAIEAHLTVVFTALAVARYLQAETGVSIGRIVKTLRPLQEISLTIAGHPHTAADPHTVEAAAILTSLELPTR
jgi:hypothetical protein